LNYEKKRKNEVDYNFDVFNDKLERKIEL
jgi:hypothetical protein